MPERPDISFLIRRSPEEIVRWFESKGFAISWNWRDVWKDQHKKAFTVAKAMNMDVLGSIREAVGEAIAEGTTFNEFRRNLEPELRKKGWWGRREVLDTETGEVLEVQLGSPWRLKNIYRTNMRTSYNGARFRQQQAVADRRPWWMYVAIIDNNTRPDHEARHQTVLRADDPWWDENYPPNDWGCRCFVRTLSDRRLDALGLQVSDGASLAGITGEGWDYNPGTEEFSPDLDEYPPDIREQYEAAQDRYQPIDP